MRKDKSLAFRLRRQNKSYSQIAKVLNIPKSTLATWFKNNIESQKTKLFLTSKTNANVAKRIKEFARRNKEKWEQWRQTAREEAKREFNFLSKKLLFVAGLMLYWAEGDSKIKNPLRLTNTDPRMIGLYVRFLVNILHIPRESLHPTLILYPDLSERTCINYWSNVIKIPKSQFYKTQFIRGRHPTKRLLNGICMINCNTRRVKEKVIVWIDLLSQKL